MKGFNLLCLFLFTTMVSKGQSPPYIPYQAIARDLSGQVKINSPIQVEFKFFNNMSSGSIKYDEVHSLTTNDLGYFNLRIGSGVIQSGTFSSINWQTGHVSYEVWVNMGLGFTQLGGRSEFLSVPYAMYAGNSNSNSNITLTINSPNTISNPSSDNYDITVPSPTLSITGNSISVSNGNTITLPTTSVTQASNIMVSGTSPNYTIAAVTPTLTAMGNATIGGAYPNQTIDVPSQTLAISGNTLNLSAGGGSVAIPAGWNLTGNAGTNPATNFIGTTDANDFTINTNNSERLRVTSTGSIAIGTAAPAADFDINTGNVKLGAGSSPFSIIKYGTLSNSILLSLGNNAGTFAIPGAQVGDIVVVTLNNHNASAGSISLNNAYISAANTLSYNINASVGLIVAFNFSYILMRP